MAALEICGINMRVCVAGCSVSDRYKISYCYGDLVSRQLAAEYVHLAASSGSNDRTWRLVTDLVVKGAITPQDLLVVQYTEVTRTEFWYEQRPTKDCEQSWDQGSVIKFKINNSKPTAIEMESKEVTKFYHLYRRHFLNTNFQQERFRLRHSEFQCLLLHYDIATVFVDTTRIGPGDYDVISQGRLSRYRDSSNENSQNNLSADDKCHFSQHGARRLAHQLVEHVHSLSWLNN